MKTMLKSRRCGYMARAGVLLVAVAVASLLVGACDGLTRWVPGSMGP